MNQANQNPARDHAGQILTDDDILLTSRQVCEARGGCSQMTLWRHIRSGQFPEPDKIINKVRYWRRSTLRRANA